MSSIEVLCGDDADFGNFRYSAVLMVFLQVNSNVGKGA